MAEKRKVIIDLIARTGGATKGVTGLQRNLTTLNKGTVKAKSNLGGMNKQIGSAKRGLSGLAGGMGSAGLAAGAIGAGVLVVGKGIQASISAFSSFDDKMNQSVAIMGDVSDAMRDDMSKAAREMATTTRFSADEAAESYFFLASAGLDAQQSIAALPAVAAFGQAGMFDMALATDLLTDAQSSLGLTVDDSAENLANMTRVSDVFVKANTLANTSVQQVSEAITNKLGGALRGANIDLEEGVAVLAAYADQGLKGAAAGESFNIVLRDLKKVNRESSAALAEHNIEIVDSEGNFRNMADIVADLEGAFMGLSVAEQAELANQLGFQDRSFKNIQLLIGQSDAIREYETELRKAGGTTEEVAGKQMESFAAQMDVIGSIVHDAAIELGGQLAPTVLEIAQGFGEFMGVITPLIPTAVTLFKALFKFSGLAAVFKTLGAAMEGLGIVAGWFDPAAKAANNFREASQGVAKAIEDGVDPAVALANGITHILRTGDLTTESLAELSAEVDLSAQQMAETTRVTLEWARANGASGVEIQVLSGALREQIMALGLTEEETLKLLEANGVLQQGMERTGNSFSDAQEAARGLRGESGNLVDAEGNLVDASGNLIDEMGNLVDAEGNVITETLTLADALAVAEENQTSLATAMREFADPTFAAISAIDKLNTAQGALAELAEDAETSSEDLAEAQLEVAKAVLEAQGALDAFDAGGIDEQVGIIAAALGISDEAARELLFTLGLIDGTTVGADVNVVFNAQGSSTAQNAFDTGGGFGGFRQHGGPVAKGEAFLVGEAGKELFVPGTSGMIVPNQALQGITNNQDNRQRNLNVTFINSQLANDPVTGIRAAFARDRMQRVA